MLTRRWIFALPLSAFLLPQPAHADTLVEGALDGVAASFGAAAKVTARVADAVAALKPGKFKRSERAGVAAGIADFDDALGQMAVAQRIVMGDIGDYIESVRAHGYDPKSHDKMWRYIVTDLREVSARVDIVQEKRRAAPWLSAALSPADEQAFADALGVRSALLDKLTALPAPRSPIELDKLAALHGRYRELIVQLGALRLELAKARQRFV